MDVPPPMTTNRTIPRAQRPRGDCFASFSLWDVFMGFLPERALALNCSFLWRISREEVDCSGGDQWTGYNEGMRQERTMCWVNEKCYRKEGVEWNQEI